MLAILSFGTPRRPTGGVYARFTRAGYQGKEDPAEPILALYGHDDMAVLASTGNGTLRITPDDYGLKVEIDPAATSVGRDVVRLVRRGDIQGIKFRRIPQEVGHHGEREDHPHDYGLHD